MVYVNNPSEHVNTADMIHMPIWDNRIKNDCYP